MAIGKSKVNVNRNKISIKFGPLKIVEKGKYLILIMKMMLPNI